jgi:hypothetical protein
VIPGTTTADEDDADAEWIAAFGDPEPALRTGTAIDEFTPIYRALARESKHHGPFAPDQVDGWDITVVAVVLGVDAGENEWVRSFKDWESEYDEWKASYAADGS